MLMKESKTILAVGSIAIDTLQTPNGNRSNILGGSATYFSLAAGLFAPIKLVGVVGNDYPEEGWHIFRSRQINMENVQIVDGKTFRWCGKYNHDYSTRKTIFTKLGVFESFSPIIHDKDCQSPLIFLGNIQPDLQLDVAKLVESPEFLVSDTMNLWIDTCKEKLMEVLAISNIFLLNHEEALQLTGEENLPAAANILRAMGPDVVIIKRGSDGAFLSFGEQTFYFPVFPIKNVIDPTGAGDSFAGGFMGYLAQSDKSDFIEAVLFGSAMASFCVEDFGPTSLLKVTRTDLDKRIAIIKSRMLTAEDV